MRKWKINYVYQHIWQQGKVVPSVKHSFCRPMEGLGYCEEWPVLLTYPRCDHVQALVECDLACVYIVIANLKVRNAVNVVGTVNTFLNIA